jgi:hypothetical protein
MAPPPVGRRYNAAAAEQSHVSMRHFYATQLSLPWPTEC